MAVALTEQASIVVNRFPTWIGFNIYSAGHVLVSAGTSQNVTWFADPEGLLKMRNALEAFFTSDRDACHDEAIRMAAEMAEVPEPVAEAVAG